MDQDLLSVGTHTEPQQETEEQQRFLLTAINKCRELINESKMNLMNKKIKAETNFSEYIENIISKDEKMLNNKLCEISKIYQQITDNSPNSLNYNLLSNEIKHKTSAIDNISASSNLILSVMTKDWFQSSIDLHLKLNACQFKLKKLQIANAKNIKPRNIESKDNEKKIIIRNLETQKMQLISENQALKKTHSNLKKEYHSILNKLQEKQYKIELKSKPLHSENVRLKQMICNICSKSTQKLHKLRKTLLPYASQTTDQQSVSLFSFIHASDIDSHTFSNNDEIQNEYEQKLQNLQQLISKNVSYAQSFADHQISFLQQMKNEQNKIISKIQKNSITLEKEREIEIQQSMKKTRKALHLEYNEKYKNVQQQILNEKQEYITYREKVLKEAKQQISDEKKHWHLQKQMLRKRYEKEIQNIKNEWQAKECLLREQISDEKKKLTELESVQMTSLDSKMREWNILKAKEIRNILGKCELRNKKLSEEYEDKLIKQRNEFQSLQIALQMEMKKLAENFKREIQILKRFKPHQIVHVPIVSRKIDEEINDRCQNPPQTANYGQLLQTYLNQN